MNACNKAIRRKNRKYFSEFLQLAISNFVCVLRRFVFSCFGKMCWTKRRKKRRKGKKKKKKKKKEKRKKGKLFVSRLFGGRCADVFDVFYCLQSERNRFWNQTKKFLCWKVAVIRAVFRLVSNHPNDKQLWEMFHFSTSESLIFGSFDVLCFGVLFCCEMLRHCSAVCFLVWIIQTTNSRTDLIILQLREDFDFFVLIRLILWKVLIVAKDIFEKNSFWSRTKQFLYWKVSIFL